MPDDDGFRFDKDESREPLGPEAKEPNPEESVPRSKFWAICGTRQNDDLVSKSENLSLERETRFQASEDG
jgi:hypothetical protein